MQLQFSWISNRVFKPYLNCFMMVVVDDVLVYSMSKEKHEEYLRCILQALRNEKLFAKLKKHEFRLVEKCIIP